MRKQAPDIFSQNALDSRKTALPLLWNLSIAFLLIGGDSSRGAPPNMGWITFQAASAFNVRVQLAPGSQQTRRCH